MSAKSDYERGLTIPCERHGVNTGEPCHEVYSIKGYQMDSRVCANRYTKACRKEDSERKVA